MHLFFDRYYATLKKKQKSSRDTNYILGYVAAHFCVSNAGRARPFLTLMLDEWSSKEPVSGSNHMKSYLYF